MTTELELEPDGGSNKALNSKLIYYRSIFDKFDTDNNDRINVTELDNLLRHGGVHEEEQFTADFVERIHKMADTNRDGWINFDEFVAMMDNPKFKDYFRKYLNLYMEAVALVPSSPSPGSRTPEYKCRPPPIGMVVISLLELLLFLIDYCNGHSLENPGAIDTALVFSPFKRQQVWRWVTYMFVHASIVHLVVNLVVQIALAVPLEMVHRWWRILVIYLAGVVTASLLHSVSQPGVGLGGASGGSYSILTAHFATLIMNWSEARYKYFHLAALLVLIGSDVGMTISDVVEGGGSNIGYYAHLGGGIAGLLVGINVLRNFRQTRLEVWIWWISMVAFVALVSVCVFLNIFWDNHFPKAFVLLVDP